MYMYNVHKEDICLHQIRSCHFYLVRNSSLWQKNTETLTNFVCWKLKNALENSTRLNNVNTFSRFLNGKDAEKLLLDFSFVVNLLSAATI